MCAAALCFMFPEKNLPDLTEIHKKIYQWSKENVPRTNFDFSDVKLSIDGM